MNISCDQARNLTQTEFLCSQEKRKRLGVPKLDPKGTEGQMWF